MSTSGFNAWDARARQLLEAGTRPHFAPDAVELEEHRRILHAWLVGAGSTRTAPRLLVLGATPELADLGLDLGFPVVRVDSSVAMFEAARLRETVLDREQEECHVADWRDLGALPTDTVHGIVGDAALNNVADGDMRTVLGELRRVLCPGGILSLKQIVFPDVSGEDLELPTVLDARRRGAISWTEFRMLVRFWCFRARAFDEVTRTLDAARVFDAVDEEHARGRWEEEEYAFLSRSRSSLRHTIYGMREQEALLKRSFGACARHTASSALHHRLFFPIYEVRNASR